MGWTGGFDGKKDAINYARSNITWSGKHALLAEKSTKLGYYAVTEDADTGKRILWVTLFEGRGRNIAIKTDGECVGFYRALDCPLAFFALLPPDGKDAARWRADVTAWHVARAVAKNVVRLRNTI